MKLSREAIDHARLEAIKGAVNYNPKAFFLLEDILKRRQIIAKDLIKNPNNEDMNRLFDYTTIDIRRLLCVNYLTERVKND